MYATPSSTSRLGSKGASFATVCVTAIGRFPKNQYPPSLAATEHTPIREYSHLQSATRLVNRMTYDKNTIMEIMRDVKHLPDDPAQ